MAKECRHGMTTRGLSDAGVTDCIFHGSVEYGFVEAGEKSGSRYQVKSALELGRHVGFLPSVANQRHAWVVEAMNRKLGRILRSRSDLVELARAALSSPRAEEQLRLDL